MTKRQRHAIFTLMMFTIVSPMVAQQVSTLFFLENAPMRHTINPAFQPVSNGYVSVSPLGYTSLWVGNNSITIHDLFGDINGDIADATDDVMPKESILPKMHDITLINVDATLNLATAGFRYKENGYFHVGVTERVECSTGIAKKLFEVMLDGGIEEAKEDDKLIIDYTNVRATTYSEIFAGYSHRINDKWLVGGKFKFLVGQVNATMRYVNLTLDSSTDLKRFYGGGNIQYSGPTHLNQLPQSINYQTFVNMTPSDIIRDVKWYDYLKPNGYGFSVDLGFAYKPHPQVQISFAINDLGFIAWKGLNYTSEIDSSYTAIKEIKENIEDIYDEFDIEEAIENIDLDELSGISPSQLGQNILSTLKDIAQSMHTTGRTNHFTHMLSATMNVGVDANFINNLLGVGVLSKTQLYNEHLYEEVTIGGAVRPCNWFNFALSYSLINNGKYSSFGTGISFMPYDGVNLTLALDYVPTSYVMYEKIPIPDKNKGINVALGFSVVWGTNPKKAKKIKTEL